MFRRKHEESHPGEHQEGRRRPRHLVGTVFMIIGIATVAYLLVTQVLMRLLAMMTV